MRKTVFLVRNTVGFGGGEVYQLELAGELRKAGFGPVIITNSMELMRRARDAEYEVLVPPYIKRQDWSGVKNLLLPVYFMRLRGLRKWYEKKVAEYRPEVVNVQSRDELIAATIAAKKYGARVIWTDHADFKNWVLWNVNVPLKNIIGKKIIKLSGLAEKVIFVSRKVKDETMKMVLPSEIKNAVVIQNGVRDEFDAYKNVSRRKMSFVFVGRVVEEKGVGELIKAFSQVRKKYPRAVLNIYGDGEIDKYRKLAGDGVEFHGATNESLKVMAENEVFVLPSYNEGLSLSLLDAAMMRKKIVTSNVDGNLEVIENGVSGILVPVKNVEQLAEAMEWMLKNSEKATKMAAAARKKYKEEFDLDKIFAEKMLPLYNDKKEL